MSDDDAAGPGAASTMAGEDAEARSERRDRMLSILAAILLGLATVGSAWSAYQSARWSGVMTIAFNEGIQLNSDAGKAYQVGDTQVNLDQSIFVAWVTAIQRGDDELAEYLAETLFSPTLTEAATEWGTTGDPETADTPFDNDVYQVPGYTFGAELETEAAGRFDAAKEANQTSDNYVLLTVLFASTMLFAGLAGTVHIASVRSGLLVVGGVLLVGAVVAMLSQPIH